MHTNILKVCSLDIFNNALPNFWMGDLSDLLSKPSHFKTPHKNDFYMFVFVDDAMGNISIDSYNSSLGSSQVFIIEPRCINTIELAGNPLGKVICFTEDFFSLRYNNNILNQFSFLESEPKLMLQLVPQTVTKFCNLLQLVHEEFNLKRTESITVLRSYINIVLFELERLAATDGVVKKPDPKLIKIRKFKRLIEIHHAVFKLPSAYANLLNVSTNYLNKLCKETGSTAGEMIRKQIIIESQRKLHFTNLTINEIAEELGFENPSYFITFFKKQTKITPEQFRKNNQNSK